MMTRWIPPSRRTVGREDRGVDETWEPEYDPRLGEDDEDEDEDEDEDDDDARGGSRPGPEAGATRERRGS